MVRNRAGAKKKNMQIKIRVRFFKESKEGIEIMCRAMEDMVNQTLKEGMVNVAKKMLKDGTVTLEKIAEFVDLSIDEVEKLRLEMLSK